MSEISRTSSREPSEFGHGRCGETAPFSSSRLRQSNGIWDGRAKQTVNHNYGPYAARIVITANESASRDESARNQRAEMDARYPPILLPPSLFCSPRDIQPWSRTKGAMHAFALNNKIRFDDISPDMTHLRPLLFFFRIKSADVAGIARTIRCAAIARFQKRIDFARSLSYSDRTWRGLIDLSLHPSPRFSSPENGRSGGMSLVTSLCLLDT